MRILTMIALVLLSSCGKDPGNGTLPLADVCNNAKEQVREQYGEPVEGFAADSWSFNFVPFPGTPVIQAATFTPTASGCAVNTTMSR